MKVLLMNRRRAHLLLIFLGLLICSTGELSAQSSTPGDCNQDGTIDLSDGVAFLNWFFVGIPLPAPAGSQSCLADSDDPTAFGLQVMDWNGDRSLDLSDGTALLTWIFGGTAGHVLGQDCIAARSSRCISTCTPQGPLTLVRGYMAVSVNPESDLQQAVDDVFLPNVQVSLLNLVTNVEGTQRRTDLSGRFTLPAEPGRYRVCWEAEGFTAGCSGKIFTVGASNTHIGTIRIPVQSDKDTTVVFGKVRLGDSSIPRRLSSVANINVFARVARFDANGNQAQEVYVNNFGDYLMPKVPTNQPITLRATVEGASREIEIHPQSQLGMAPFHSFNLILANRPPRLYPLVATDAAGLTVKTAAPGTTVNLEAEILDPDGDSLGFKWVVPDGSGLLSANDQPAVTWTLPSSQGRYSVTVFAFDGKGGYVSSTLSLRVDQAGIPFSGLVDATNAPVVVGAQVEVNGQLAVTDASGFFQLRVGNADRFVMNIRHPQYMLVSNIYDGEVSGGRWTMTRATVITNVDPTRDIRVVSQRDESDCPGPAADRLNWRGFPHLAEPQWQDGLSNVVAPFDRLRVPLPGLQPIRKGECGEGIRVQIPPNSLVDQNGQPPVGNVDIALSTIDLLSPEQMPGDYTALTPDGETRVMQSWGAGYIEITDGFKHYNLAPGAIARVEIPVDPSQLAAGGVLDPTIPVLHYDEQNGVWIEDGIAFLQGNTYVTDVTHFSVINMDVLMVNQACIRVLSPTLAATYRLEILVPMEDSLGNPAAPKIRSELINNASPSEHVLYNLPTNTNIVLVPIRLTSDANTTGCNPLPGNEEIPYGTFVVNTGGEQNPTNPNLPAGPPYTACSTEVTLSDLGVPSAPLSGEFLHGLFSFSATNLDELNPGNPADVALANALDQATTDYYAQIDPCNRRQTLDCFIEVNNFAAGETTAVFANSGDLGFGREMHCTQNGADVACYVTNYGDINSSDVADAAEAVLGFNNDPNAIVVATVAMEYSRIETSCGAASPTCGNNPAAFDTDQVVKFYVYNNNGTQLLKNADLDEQGARPIPQLCMVCHGGEYPGGSVVGSAPPFSSLADVKLNSKFLPFDVSLYTFASAPFDCASQQAAFKTLNETIVKDHPPNAAIAEVITEMYAGGSTQDDDFVVAGWDDGLPTVSIDELMYQEVIAPSCRTCHLSNTFVASPSLAFNDTSHVEQRLGAVEIRTCGELVMPHAKVTHKLFWESQNLHQPGVLQLYGDEKSTAGWNGTLCGSFTGGGTTPSTYYELNIQPLWESNFGGTTTPCTSCHNSDPGPAGLNLLPASPPAAGDVYDNLVNADSTKLPAMKRIQPNDVANSFLIHKLEDDLALPCPVSCGGQMPAIGAAWNVADINLIKNWINAGAPE